LTGPSHWASVDDESRWLRPVSKETKPSRDLDESGRKEHRATLETYEAQPGKRRARSRGRQPLKRADLELRMEEVVTLTWIEDELEQR
jgi:hypothetical protein